MEWHSCFRRLLCISSIFVFMEKFQTMGYFRGAFCKDPPILDVSGGKDEARAVQRIRQGGLDLEVLVGFGV